MGRVRCGAHEVELGPDETVLDGLTRVGVEVASSCRAGACQSCLVRAVSGDVPDVARRGLRAALCERGWFLSCCARPSGDIEVALADAELRIAATIVGLERRGASVILVRIVPERPLPHRAGQYLSLVRPDGLARSYSIASVPELDATIELHVRLVTDGAMSGWLATDARVGGRVALIGPAGECCYADTDRRRGLLLAGTGTGIAPLHGILRDALRHGHHGPIVVAHGARDADGLYLDDELSAIARAHANVRYLRVARVGSEAPGLAIGDLGERLVHEVPSPKGWSVHLCGDPDWVAATRRRLFLAGASIADIHADAFLPSRPMPAPQTSATGT